MIEGVRLIPLTMHRDGRGHVAEFFAADWAELVGFDPVQWHVLRTRAGALRGMHAHARHADLKVVLAGEITLALGDVRPHSPTAGETELHQLSGDDVAGVMIPIGVAHGIYANTDSVVAVAVTLAYDGTDEYECAWDDPELGLEWPAAPTLLSARDANAGSRSDLVAALEQAWAATPARR